MGASHARHLAEEGAAVVIGDVLDAQGGELADQLQAEGLNVSYAHLDVTDEASWHAAVDHALHRLGGLDGLVNNAGITGTTGGPEVEDPGDHNVAAHLKDGRADLLAFNAFRRGGTDRLNR